MKNLNEMPVDKITGFDAKTGANFTAEIVGPPYDRRIIGEGYFIIIEPNSKYVSFSKSKHDICYGHIVSDIIHEYTNEQYVKDYRDILFNDGKKYSDWTIKYFNQYQILKFTQE